MLKTSLGAVGLFRMQALEPEMAQQVTALDAMSEDLGSIPGILVDGRNQVLQVVLYPPLRCAATLPSPANK